MPYEKPSEERLAKVDEFVREALSRFDAAQDPHLPPNPKFEGPIAETVVQEAPGVQPKE